MRVISIFFLFLFCSKVLALSANIKVSETHSYAFTVADSDQTAFTYQKNQEGMPSAKDQKPTQFAILPEFIIHETTGIEVAYTSYFLVIITKIEKDTVHISFPELHMEPRTVHYSELHREIDLEIIKQAIAPQFFKSLLLEKDCTDCFSYDFQDPSNNYDYWEFAENQS